MQGGDLFHHLSKASANGYDGLGFRRAQFYTAQLVSAILHLHGLRIAYRDLKPSNVMLDDLGHVRLVDFGLCKHNISYSSTSGRSAARTFVGTRAYVAPEVVRMSTRFSDLTGTAPGQRPIGCVWRRESETGIFTTSR